MRIRTLLELTRPSLTDAEARLRQAGYGVLSTAGNFSRVWDRPDADHVLKLFSTTDQGYWTFLRFCMTARSPYLPRLRGRPIQVNHHYSAVRLERLEPLDHLSWVVEPMQAVFHNPDVPADRRHAVIRLGATYPKLIDTIRVIKQVCLNDQHLHPDLFERNIMRRGDVPVIIDPISYSDAWGIKEIPPTPKRRTPPMGMSPELQDIANA